MSKIDAEQHESIVRTRREFWLLVLIFFGVGGLVWGGWAWWADRSYRSAIMAIEARNGERPIWDRRPRIEQASGA